MNTRQHVKNILKDHGSSLAQFAIDKGHNYSTVCTVVERWGHREDKKPHGGLARQIMVDLIEYVEQVRNSDDGVANQKFATQKQVRNSQDTESK